MSSSLPTKIRGNVLLSRLTFVRNRGDAGAVERILSSLIPEDQAVLRGRIWDAGLYSFELNQRLDRAIARLLSPTNPTRIFVEMGRASAENNLEGPHKVFIRPNEPQRFLAQAPYIYKFYYAAGRRTYEKVGPSAAVIRTYEAESVTAADCLTVVGWHQRALEICGAKGVVVTERQCRTEGHAHCEYLCEWTGP